MARVLNIGFGPLNLEKIVLADSYKGTWIGINISKEAVKNAKNIFANYKFYNKSIINCNIGKNKYDIVLALEVLEHISFKNIFSVLDKIYKSLSNNGYFIISIPLNEGLDKLVLNGNNPNAHMRVYTKELIKFELTISKFIIIKTISLSAFHKFYNIKNFISKIFPEKFIKNNLIILAQKI